MRRNALLFSGFYCCRRSFVVLTSSFNKQNCNFGSTVDANNVNIFKQSNSEWMNEKSGAFKPLHSLNRLRVPWIVSHFKHSQLPAAKLLSGVRLLDVGCGGGLLSLALCRLGATVVGLDVNEESIQLANDVAQGTLKADQLKNIQFACSTIEDYAAENAQSFDGVLASEVLEHVTDLSIFLQNCVSLAKPKSHLLFTTINKTIFSQIFAIWLAEDVFSIVPKGVHKWEQCVEPSKLRQILLNHNCRVRAPIGMIYNPLVNSWNWSTFDQINYALSATRN